MGDASKQHEHGEDRSPVAIAPDPRLAGQPALRWTSVTIGTAALLLTLGNAGVLTGWLQELPPSAAVQRALDPAGAWERQTTRLHLDAPRATIHRWWEAARAARFGDEHPGEPGRD